MKRPSEGTVLRLVQAGLATSLDFRRLSFERMLAWAGPGRGATPGG